MSGARSFGPDEWSRLEALWETARGLPPDEEMTSCAQSSSRCLVARVPLNRSSTGSSTLSPGPDQRVLRTSRPRVRWKGWRTAP